MTSSFAPSAEAYEKGPIEPRFFYLIYLQIEVTNELTFSVERGLDEEIGEEELKIEMRNFGFRGK